jgi:MYXO-CTERM domain-containing protein
MPLVEETTQRKKEAFMLRGRRRAAAGWLCLVGLCLVVPAVQANIDLEWRPLSQTVIVGQPLGIGLYAVSDSSQSQWFSAAQVIIGWDPAYLLLTGNDDTGGVDWLGSGFIPGDSFGINEANPPADGDGMWTGMVTFGEERPASPAGTLLTTITFNALALTSETLVTILPSASHPPYPTGYTKLLSLQGSVLGNLGSPAGVTIIPEPAGLTLLALGGLLLGARRR